MGALIALGAVLLSAGVLARSTFGRHFPSLFVDPFGCVSNVFLPAWDTPDTQVGDPQPRFPDRVVAIDGEPIDGTASWGRLPSERIYSRLASLAQLGLERVTLTFERAGSRYQKTQVLRRIGLFEILLFYGLYSVSAVLTLWSGVVVLHLAGERTGGLAYAFWSVGAFLLLVTFFDYHTTSRLAPLFSLSTVWATLGFLALALAFPEMPKLSTPSKVLILCVCAVGVACAVGLAIGPRLGLDLSVARMATTVILPASATLLVVALLVRMRMNKDRRSEIASALFGIALVPAIAAAGSLTMNFGAMATMHAFAPLLVPLIPASIGYSLIKHNVLATRMVVTSRLLLVPVGSVSLAVGILVWWGLHEAVQRLSSTDAAPLAMAATTSTAVFALLHRAGRRYLFPATAAFRPTIEQLSDQLGSLTSANAVRGTIAAVVKQWLPAASVNVRDPDTLATGGDLPVDCAERLRAGRSVFTDEGPFARRLLVPMRSRGELYGVLECDGKRAGAIYTQEDLTLLETVAGLGGLALHNVQVMLVQEQLRRLQLATSEDDKRLALSTLGAELSHEIKHSLIFFRYLLAQAPDQRLETEDIEIGQKEVSRLQRTLDNLRRLDFLPLHTQTVRLVEVVTHAQALVRDIIREKQLAVSVEIAPDLDIIAAPDPLLQAMINLLRNAAQAAPAGSGIGVRTEVSGDVLNVEVWDDGPGVPQGMEKTIFQPWVSLRPEGTGLGLAVVQRIVTGLGWSISVERRKSRTFFVLRINQSHVLSTSTTE
ncbi:MAG: GAF domain-containing sensor histidine kinase [Deltaproteobacteria bacterium]